MKTRLPSERLKEKIEETLVINHLRQRYHFSPVVAEALSSDFQWLRQYMHSGWDLEEGQIRYPAVKNSEPAGKALERCSYVMVRLTIYAKADLEIRQRKGLKALKKHVLMRITSEADSQGGPLTYEDLSRLLFADRKTIGQYIEELRAEGKSIVTRATYTDASATISHHRPIIELFLLNYTETEIAQRQNHSLERVEAYIKDFLRICICHRQGCSVNGIRHLTQLAKNVIEKHLRHYEELRASPIWRERLERTLCFYEVQLNTPLVEKRGLS